MTPAEGLAIAGRAALGTRLNESPPWRPLGQLLVAEGLISEADLAEALETQKENGKMLGEIFVESGLVSRIAVARVLALQWGVTLEEERGYGYGLRGELERRKLGGEATGAELGEPPADEDPIDAAPEPGDRLLARVAEQQALLADLEEQAGEQERALAAAADRVAAQQERLEELDRRLREREERIDELEEQLEAQVVPLRAVSSGYPFVDLRRREVDYGVARFFPEDDARENEALPISFEDGVVTVAMADPDDARIDRVRLLLGRDADFVTADRTLLLRAMDETYTGVGR